MKRLFIFTSVILTLVACIMLGGCRKGGGGSGTNNNGGSSGGGTSNDALTILVNGNISGAVQDLQVALGDALGEMPYIVTDSSAKGEADIVIGNSSLAIAQRAKTLLERNEREGKYLPRYVVYSDGKSIAIAYDECEGYNDFVQESAINCLLDNFLTDGGLNLDGETLISKEADVLAYQETLDNAMLDAKWAVLEKQAGKETADAIRAMYGMYSDKAIEWMADLYDPDIGGFYATNSARNNIGYLPNIESTSQAMDFLRISGMLAEYGDDLKDGLPEWFQQQMIAFVKGLQDPNGYFYHPQWGKELTDTKLARRGRDLTKGLDLLARLGAKPTYDTPNGVEGDGLLADGTPVSRVLLTTPIGSSTAVAVSKVVATSEGAVTPHLASLDAFQKYLASLDINSDPYSVGNELASQASEIYNRDIQLKMQGADYSLVETIQEWLDSHCYESTGHWYAINDYMGLNGLMKISAAYQSLKIPLPYPEKAAEFAIDMITTDEREETVCYAYNTWFAVGNILSNVKKFCSKSEADRIVGSIMDRIYGSAPTLIASTHQKQLQFLLEDGSFAYAMDEAGNLHCGYLSQGVPASVPNTREGSINSTLICISETLSHMFFVLEYDMVPVYTKSDLLRFIDRLENLTAIVKTPEQVVKNIATFDNGTVGETSDEVKISNISSSTITVVNDPRPGASKAGKVLEFNAVSDGAKSVMTEFNTSANSLFHCYVFEGEYCFAQASDGYMAHLNVGPECYMIGFKAAGGKVYLYEESSDTGANSREVDLGIGFSFGEWFKIKVEYYIESIDNPRIKLYVNDELVSVSDNYYNRNGSKLNGEKAVAKSRYEGATFLVFSYSDALVYMDNLSCYKIRDSYVPLTENQKQPKFNVDAPDRAQTVYDFESDTVGSAPENLNSSGAAVRQDADGNYLDLTASASSVSFPLNIRTTKTNCSVFEAQMYIDGSAVGKNLTLTFSEEARVANPIAKFNITVTRSNGTTAAYIYNAPNGISEGVVSGATLPTGREFTFRAEHYDIHRITLFYIDGNLVASSDSTCLNAQKYVAARVDITSAGCGAKIDNAVSERIVKSFDDAIRPNVDSKVYDFTAGMGDINAQGGATVSGGQLLLDSGATLKIPVNQRSVISTAAIFETEIITNKLTRGSVIRISLCDANGNIVLSYDLKADDTHLLILERTAAGSYTDSIYKISKSSSKTRISITYYFDKGCAFISVGATPVVKSELTYNRDSFTAQTDYILIETIGGSGYTLDNIKAESYNLTYSEPDIPKFTNSEDKSLLLTYEGSSSGNLPKPITSDMKSMGSSIAVKEIVRKNETTKALLFTTRTGYNDSLMIGLTSNEYRYNCTVFETDFRFDFPTSQTSFQIYLEDGSNPAYMINLVKNGETIRFHDVSSAGQVKNIGVDVVLDDHDEWYNLRIEYYNGTRDTVRIKVYIDGELVLVSNNFWGSEIDKATPQSSITRVRFYAYATTEATLSLDNTSLYQTIKDCADDPLTEPEDPGEPDTTISGTATFEEEEIGQVSNRITSSHKNEYTYLTVERDPRDAAKKVLKFYKYNTTETDDTYNKHAPIVTIPLTETCEGYNAFVFEADIKLDYLKNAKSTNYKMYMGTKETTSYTFEFYRSGEYLVFRDSSNTTSGISSGPLTTTIKLADWFNFRLEYYVGDQNTVRIKIYLNGDLFYVSNNFFGPKLTDEAGASYTVNNEITELRIVPYGDLEGTMYLDEVDMKQDVLTLKNDPIGLPTITPPEETEPFDAKVLPVKGGAKSIVVLVHDDGDLATASILDKLYKKYSLRGDVAITAERFAGATPNTAEINGWQALLDTGRWGMINHSMTHDFWGDSTTGEVDENLIIQEVLTSREVLKAAFPTERFLVYAYPGISAVTNKFGLSVYDAVKKMVKDNYLAGRFYSGGSANFYDWDWENMPTYAVDLNKQNSLDAIERAARAGEFISLLFHKVLTDETIDANPAYQGDSYYTRESHLEAVCKKLSDYVQKGAVWSANYEDAVLYLREAENATVTTARTQSEITVTVDDGLDDSLYNFPLTVRISVSVDWEAVKIVQGENVTYARKVTQNGITFIDADIVPDGTEVSVTPIAESDIPVPEAPEVPDSGVNNDSLDFGGSNKDDDAWIDN